MQPALSKRVNDVENLYNNNKHSLAKKNLRVYILSSFTFKTGGKCGKFNEVFVVDKPKFR